MPVPTLADPAPNSTSASAATPTKLGQPSQKSMTKAERRELQEKQRATKRQQQGGGSQTKASKTPATTQKKAQAGETPKQAMSAAREASAAAIDEVTGGEAISQSLRIFSHFGLPKPVSHVKGDIHPAIIRLGLLFSEFKICGANARCIATLTAFKSVRFDRLPIYLELSHSILRLSKTIPHLQIIPFRAIL